MAKSLLIFIFGIFIVLIATLFLIKRNKKSNILKLVNFNERCPACSTEHQIGLIRACKCSDNTTLKTDLYGHSYCAVRKEYCKSKWQTCTGSCPDKNGFCKGECLYDGS